MKPRSPHAPASRPNVETESRSFPLTHPAWWLAGLAAAAGIVVSVSFEIYEKDFWQHLLVGKAIWQLGHVPTTQIWCWPTYGAPDVNTSWGFRALIWPVWSVGGVWGLFAWRWITTLAAFAILWAAARRMGARGFTPLVVLVLCALTYRQRSQVRPETLVAVLFALQIWILETRRHGGPDRSWWLVPLAWAWINTHISYHLGFAILGAHIVQAHWRARGGSATRGPGRLWKVAALALAISFLNPFGWRALWQPIEFFLVQRHEPIYQGIFELLPLPLSHNVRNLLPLILVGWPLLMAWRWRRAGLDAVELLCWAGFTGLSFLSQRFLGFMVLAAAPYLARDLDAFVAARRWPMWTSSAWMRAALTATACVTIGLWEWSRADLPIRVGLDLREYPVAACDWMGAHAVKGRGFNQFYYGGYLLYRFWPDQERLPFMDIHQTGTPRDRYAYVHARGDRRAWRELDDRHRFEYAVLRRLPYPGDAMLEILDTDTTWALVFMDDAAALYVRRDGPLAAMGDSFAYRIVGAGSMKMNALSDSVRANPALRPRVAAELEREASESRFNGLALSRMGTTALLNGDLARARELLERARAVDPMTERAHEWLGVVTLAEGRPEDALQHFETQRRLSGWEIGYDFRRGQAWQAMGDLRRARAAFERELRRDPGNQEVRDSLAVVGAPLPRR